MDLKNAAAVCLISLFSATLVVLITRAVENQTASRLETQLTNIAEELRSLRKQSGIAMTAPDDTAGDGLIVYYFHSNTRCPSCLAIERRTQAIVENDFAAQVKSRDIIWKNLNYEEPEPSN